MDHPILITDVRILTPNQVIDRGWLLCHEDVIAAFAPGDAPARDDVQIINGQNLTLLPGFVDIHVHGGVGHDTMDASATSLQQMAQFYARHGVTSFLATTWTDSRDRIMSALQAIREAMRQPIAGARLLGTHLEGPYLNPAKSGAQNVDYIRRAAREEALSFLDLDVIRLLAIAPEFEENEWLIQECVQRGIAVSAAHTNASYEDIKRSVAMGLTQATHTYNAMTGLYHREPGVVGAALALDNITCELIADNIHVHPAAMKILWACKGKDRLVLISDAMRAAGMPDGEYKVDERTVTLKDGAVRLPDGSLAGSVLTMDQALRNFMSATSESLSAVWQTTSLTPARAIHVADRKGSIEVGKDADLILADEMVHVHCTIVEGHIVYRKDT